MVETNDAVIAQGLTPDLATVAPDMGTVMTPARFTRPAPHRWFSGWADRTRLSLATDGQALQLWADLKPWLRVRRQTE